MQFPEWLRNLIHIETLFLMGVTVTVFYFMWKYRSPRKGLQKLEELAGSMLLIPKDMIKKKRAAPRINKHEERCREIFEEIFETDFVSIRPDWLKNPITNRNLELDGFCENIKTPVGKGLAFEYDGAQHSKYIPGSHFHRNGPMEFVYQTKKDSWKDMTCKNKGVMLIRIPSFVPYDDMERYIKQELRKRGMGKYINEYDNLAPGY
jgi:hypothetical protein